MLHRIITRSLFSATKQSQQQVVPKAPRLISGELQSFKYEYENSQIYDGYTLDELYGAKKGAKNPPAIEAEMRKDTIASVLLFAGIVGLTFHLHHLFLGQLADIKSVNEGRLTREVKLPPHATQHFK